MMSEELEQPPVETEDKPSIDDTIRETLRSINERETTETAEATGDRPRDDKGRFAPKETQGMDTAPSGDVPVAGSSPAPAPDDPTMKPPSSWSAAAQTKWAQMDAELRAEAHKRETDFHKGLEQYKQAAQFGQSIYQEIAPHLETLRSLNATPQQAVKALLEADRSLRQGSMAQKREALGRIIQQYGITFDDGAAPPQPDPSVFLQQIPQMVRQTLSQERENMELQSAVSQVEQFAATKDRFQVMNGPDGQKFRGLMVGALNSGIATNLEEAYDAAARAHPGTFAKLTAERQEADAKKKAEENAQRVAQARAASAVNVRQRGVLPAAKPKGSIEDTIRETYRKLNG